MRRLTRLLAAALLATALPAAPAVAGEDWVADYDQAVKIAQKEGKNLLVDFTGSDWCGWCIKLHDEVFRHEEFLRYARNGYVLVSLDFPKSEEAKAKVPNPGRNAELRDLHQVRGYPTILLMTPEGAVFAQTGYQQGGPAAYVAHLQEISAGPLAELARVDEIRKAFAASDGGPEAFTGLLDAFDGLPERSAFAPRLEAPIRARLGQGDEALRRRVASALVRMGRVDDPVLAEVAAIDPKNAAGLHSDALLVVVEAVAVDDAIRPAADRIHAFFGIEGLQQPERESAVLLCVYGAYWDMNFLDDPARAKELAQRGLQHMAADHRARNLLQTIAGT